jgi:hypothetical protein
MSAQPWRIINLVLAVWLVLSAFMWGHSMQQFHNAWISGLAAALIASVAAIYQPLRLLNTLLALWLIASAWVLPSASGATLWNHVIAGVVMFIASLFTVRGTTFAVR